jgi:SAM-dependent methyltransferase
LKKALAFLQTSATPDYGRRLARLRWIRAIPADEVRDFREDSCAAVALAGAQSWVFVRDPMAVPLPAPRFPVPGPGRVLLVETKIQSLEPVHTLRELESTQPAPPRNSPPDPAEISRCPAVGFRAGDFPAEKGETISQLLERLLRDAKEKEFDREFRALVLEDPSERERPELTRLFPADALRLLDVGCGAGGTSAALKRRLARLEAVGIEKDPAAAARARRGLDRVLEGDAAAELARLARDGESFDAFLFADVLEHLADPVAALALARAITRPGATLLASVPNVGHLSLVRDLVFGRFDPTPAGLADAGHLRWFDRRFLAEALEESGWRVVSIEAEAGAPAPSARAFLDRVESWPGLDRESLATYQWIAVARAESTAGQGRPAPRPAAKDEDDEESLLCALDSPPFHRVRSGERTLFRGMALDTRGRVLRGVRVSIDGRPTGDFASDRPSEEISRWLPNLPAAGCCRFEFDLPVPAGADVLRFDALREDGRAEPLFEYDLAAIRKSSSELEAMGRALEAFPAPEPDVVFQTQGHRDAAAYQDSILPALVNAKRYLARAGVASDRITSILDFGCGSGRVLLGWHLEGAGRDLFGCDTSEALIAWAKAHLPAAIRFDRTAPRPPLPYPDRRFDLVCAVSVFTHLAYDTQWLWARELARVVKPGGSLLLTLHGKPYVRLFLPERLEEFERTGHVETGEAADGTNTFASFHGQGAVEELFSGFERIGYFPSGRIDGKRTLFPLAAFQDVYVLRRRAGAEATG